MNSKILRLKMLEDFNQLKYSKNYLVTISEYGFEGEPLFFYEICWAGGVADVKTANNFAGQIAHATIVCEMLNDILKKENRSEAKK